MILSLRIAFPSTVGISWEIRNYFVIPFSTRDIVTQSNKQKHVAEHNYVFQLSSMVGEHMLFSVMCTTL